MEFVLSIHAPDVDRPGIAIAQTLREVEPVIERMNPLVPGYLDDRLSGERKAHWQTWGFVPLVTAPIIDVYGPDPGPVGEGTVGFSLTGNFFPPGIELYIDGVPVNHTDVYSQWSITGNMNKRKAPGNAQAMLMYDGIGYAHFQWPFGDAEVVEGQPAT